MKQLDLIHRINELLSRFVTQVKGASAISLFDINLISEDILVPLFKEIFGYSHLRNVNEDNLNYPGIDLADEANRVAFQVTSTSTSSKINHSLSQFFKYQLNEKYDRFIFYILSEKQKSYTIRNTTLETSYFKFSAVRDILDFQSLLKIVRGLPFEKIERVKSILEKQFSIENNFTFNQAQDNNITEIKSWKLKTSNPETLYANLLEIKFPNTLYIAELNIDRKETIKASRTTGGQFLKYSAPTRKIVQEALRQNGLRFANDWTCHENKIITFHNLNDSSIPLARIIDEGIIEEFDTEDFFSIDRDYENVFRGLLHFCLQRMLYHKKVEWKHKDKLFAFMPEDTEIKKREISWHSKVSAKRAVFDSYINKKTGKLSYCKHLAFRTRYRHYGDKWFLEIIPDWYITMNGFRKSLFGADRVKWLKGQERNQQVFNHLKFIAFFLKHKDQPNIFDQQKIINPGFLSFNNLVTLNGHQLIDDSDWNEKESEEEQKRMNDKQGVFPWSFETQQ